MKIEEAPDNENKCKKEKVRNDNQYFIFDQTGRLHFNQKPVYKYSR